MEVIEDIDSDLEGDDADAPEIDVPPQVGVALRVLEQIEWMRYRRDRLVYPSTSELLPADEGPLYRSARACLMNYMSGITIYNSPDPNRIEEQSPSCEPLSDA